jgi:hypothetical protein
MLRATRRRLGSPAWLATGLVIFLPALAEAQLFPNRTIRRQRPPCASEPPFNAQVRRDYFGYYPTCWSKFPEGWACPCPNPEQQLQNIAAESFRKIPFNEKRIDDEALPGMGEENPDAMGEGRPGNAPGDVPNNVPLPNRGRSPFDLDTNPNPRPPATRPNPDPFLDPDPTRPAPRDNAPTNPTTNPRPSTGLMEMPQLPSTEPTTSTEPTLLPGSMVMVPEATLASNNSDLRPDLGPLPSAPLPGSGYPPNFAPSADSMPVLTQPTPAQAPRRRSFLGRIFGPANTVKR